MSRTADIILRHPTSAGLYTVTCLNMWTVKNWTVITNPNPNRSPNPILTVQISTVQISPGNFTVQILTVHNRPDTGLYRY